MLRFASLVGILLLARTIPSFGQCPPGHVCVPIDSFNQFQFAPQTAPQFYSSDCWGSRSYSYQGFPGFAPQMSYPYMPYAGVRESYQPQFYGGQQCQSQTVPSVPNIVMYSTTYYGTPRRRWSLRANAQIAASRSSRF
jgi:hypothetical protein